MSAFRTATIRRAALLLLLACLSGTAEAEATAFGPCFTVHGTLSLAEGTPPVRLHDARRHRTYGVAPMIDQDNETFQAPADVRARVDYDRPLTGTFQACPLGPAQGRGFRQISIGSWSPAH